VPSPDTDELSTLPIPAGAPDAGSAAASRAVPQQQTEPLAVEPDAQTVPQDPVEPERVEAADTTSTDASPEAAEPGKPRGRWWRGFTGSLAAGLTVLAIGVLAVAVIDLNTGAPGPGAVLLIGHPVAAVLALLAQRVADRRNGASAAGAGVAVVLFTVSALTLFWLT
jgi:predicted lipid-binding transport protein (Tim44 family)